MASVCTPAFDEGRYIDPRKPREEAIVTSARPAAIAGATPVVGYLRAGTPAAVVELHGVLEEYAARTGLLVWDVVRETAGASAVTLPGFAGCLEMIRTRAVRGVLLPTWGHLAPNGLLGASLLQAARRADAPLFVADQSEVPGWAAGAAASAPLSQADQRAGVAPDDTQPSDPAPSGAPDGRPAPESRELAWKNRRTLARRLGWPDGAAEACERVERAHLRWHPSWCPGYGRTRPRPGFYAVLWKEDLRLRPVIFGADGPALARAIETYEREGVTAVLAGWGGRR